LPSVRGIPGPYRLFFFSFDCREPEHIHVQRDRMICKFWLDPVVLASNQGYSAVELNTIRRILREHSDRILEAWHEHCGGDR
jgi:hypothetical protein